MAAKALHAVKSKQIELLPKRFEKVWLMGHFNCVIFEAILSWICGIVWTWISGMFLVVWLYVMCVDVGGLVGGRQC